MEYPRATCARRGFVEYDGETFRFYGGGGFTES